MEEVEARCIVALGLVVVGSWGGGGGGGVEALE